MADDVSPLTALVRICEALPQCNDAATRRELIQASATLRSLIRRPRPSKLSHLGRKIVAVCAGQKHLTGRRIAQLVGRAYSGSVREEIKALRRQGHVRKEAEGTFEVLAEKPSKLSGHGGQVGGKSPTLDFSKERKSS